MRALAEGVERESVAVEDYSAGKGLYGYCPEVSRTHYRLRRAMCRAGRVLGRHRILDRSIELVRG